MERSTNKYTCYIAYGPESKYLELVINGFKTTYATFSDIEEIRNDFEVNDNPSIDAGIEDTILQDELYLKIMSGLLDSVEKQKNGYFPA